MASEVQNEVAADVADALVVSNPDTAPAPAETAAQAPKPKPAKRHRTGLTARLFWLFVIFGLIFAALALTGKPIPMPVWLVAEIEQRANTALAKTMPEAALALGGVEITVDSDWVPRLRLEDVRLLKPGGQALVTLPDLRLTLLVGGAAQRWHLGPGAVTSTVQGWRAHAPRSP